MEHTLQPETTPASPWHSLYIPGGVAALFLLAYSLATLLIITLTGGQPATVEECFRMLQENRLVGLLRLDLLTVFCMPLYYLLFLSCCIALWRVRLVQAALATLLVFIGVTLFLSTPSVYAYLFLSDRFAAAATEAQRAQLLAAGEAIYASDMWRGTGAQLGGMLLQAGALWISMVMLRDPRPGQAAAFGRLTAWVGIVTHGLDLLHILVNFAVPGAGDPIMMAAGPLYLAWFPLIAWRLFRLGQRGESVALNITNPRLFHSQV